MHRKVLLKSTLTAEAWSTVTEVLLVFAKRKQERFDIHTFPHPFLFQRSKFIQMALEK